MTFDKQEHKDLIMALLTQAQYPGSVLELAYEVKKAVEVATIKD